MSCDLQYFDDENMSRVVYADDELAPACFSLESQALLQLLGEDVTIGLSAKRTFLNPIDPRVISALLV